jgi:hypothetical protein
MWFHNTGSEHIFREFFGVFFDGDWFLKKQVLFTFMDELVRI